MPPNTPPRPCRSSIHFRRARCTDIVARILTPKMSAALGQPVVIVNKSGGGGAVGIQAAKEAAADGYTILVTPPPVLLIPLVSKNSGFTMKDFTPLALATSSPNTTVVRKESPWKTFEEFIAEAKKNPGQLTYGSAGPGTTPHFIGELVKMKTGIDLTARAAGLRVRRGHSGFGRPCQHLLSHAGHHPKSH